MGRSKKALPTRRTPGVSAGGTEVLGRITLAEGESLEDLLVSPTERQEPEPTPSEEPNKQLRTEDTSSRESTRELRQKKKLRGVILDDDSDDETEDHVSTRTTKESIVSRKSRRRRVLFEDEAEEETQQTTNNTDGQRDNSKKRKQSSGSKEKARPRKQQRKRKTNSRSGPLASSDQRNTLRRPSELQIRKESNDVYHIKYIGDLKACEDTIAENVGEIRRFDLPLDQCKVNLASKALGNESNKKLPSHLPLSAGSSVLVLGRRIFDRKWINFANCVEEGLLIASLKLVSSSWVLSISMGTKAMTVCHASALPLLRVAHAPRYQSARWVNSAISELFGTPDATSNPDTPKAITATDVYKLTDNQQISHILQSSKSLPGPNSLTIPGLVPKLRPYQVAAVQWMLDREQNPRASEEWKVAWVVLDGSIPSPDPAVSLVSWESVTRPDKAAVLFCPLIGWLASSVEEARGMTLGGNQDYPSVTGGILAESMGLGKSVELIALILANRRKNERENSTRGALFQDKDSDSNNDNLHVSAQINAPVEDYTEFADADEESNSEGKDDSPSTSSNPTTPPRGISFPVQITPDTLLASLSNDVEIEERFVDEDETALGTCLCGAVIEVHDSTDSKPVVLCCQCDLPMHMMCCGFTDVSNMKRSTKELSIRKMYSNQRWSCWKTLDYRHCPCCVAEKQDVVESGATLIVTPPAILEQWEREIERHTLDNRSGSPLRVTVYKGVEKITKSRQGMAGIHPFLLADHDIVLMTFNSLMADLGHSDDNRFVGDARGGNLRKRKKYRVVPSPLLSIDWFRVCLDESQRIERPTAASAQMALKLKTNHRWCVSGSPVGRGKLEDLYGLLLFLGLNPFFQKHFFTKVLDPAHHDIYSRIEYLFGVGSLFWRSTKANELVKEQMGVPEQQEKKNILKFSSIERHFYERQLQETMVYAGDFAERRKEGKKDKVKDLNLLAENLHRLRAACCHPQVGSAGLKKRTGAAESSSIGARVLSMEEILVQLIDDARVKCEESQRQAILHANGMAALSRLKAEADSRGVAFSITGAEALHESCRLYLEALALGESNSKPTPVLSDASLRGSLGFRNSDVMKRGTARMEWKLDNIQHNFSVQIDFDGIARRIIRLRLRPVLRVPQALCKDVASDFCWRILRLENCVVQTTSNSEEFFDVASSKCHSGDWTTVEFLGTSRSKSWRLAFHATDTIESSDMITSAYYFGVEVALDEADISCDSLQRLHSLHNAGLAFRSLAALQDREHDKSDHEDLAFADFDEMKRKIDKLGVEAKSIEGQYMQTAQAVHSAFKQRMLQSFEARSRAEEKMKSGTDLWDSGWWDEFLALCQVQGSEDLKSAIYSMFSEELQGMQAASSMSGLIQFPHIRDLSGLSIALSARINSIRNGIGKKVGWLGTGEGDGPTFQRRADYFKCPRGSHSSCMEKILNLNPNPGNDMIFENAQCGVCKSDWGRSGPKCRHCFLGDHLAELEPDRVTVFVLTTLYNILKGALGKQITADSCPNLADRAKDFFDILEAQRKEKVVAWRCWRTHLDLLNDMDELNQCKESMRLSYIGEDLTALTKEELNAVVMPHDIEGQYYDHAAKHAMCLGNLRRSQETLRYLRNQSTENSDQSVSPAPEQCAVCLCEFGEADRAVLKCGHSFHLTCLENLKLPGGGSIRCPMRCRILTPIDSVLLAVANSKKDDGTKAKRNVSGSWGVKVTKVISDLLDIKDLGEKVVLFSQWEDMLEIVGRACTENGIIIARAASLSKIGSALKVFRSRDCTVLMLNVKNGAEGLTIVEARHVFMLEPLLNRALDEQAINRVCRFGQKHKTTVHRYIVECTVEVKIDEARMQSSHEALEDSKAVKHAVGAGGVDGGFSSEKELLELLS